MLKREGQAWGFDLMIAFVIFIIGIVAFFLYALNYPTEGEEIIDTLSYEADLIAENLLSEGHPKNWTVGNVEVIGLTNDDRINQTKLNNFESLALSDYNLTKTLLNTRYDYYINITNSTDSKIIGRLPVEPTNLIKVARVSLYNNEAVQMDVYVWE